MARDQPPPGGKREPEVGSRGRPGANVGWSRGLAHQLVHVAVKPPTTDLTMTPSAATAKATARFAAPDPLTERSRIIWSAGSYDRISAGFRHEAAAFVDRLHLTPGERVLDAACGSGNLTIPAARSGATVTGLDLVPELLELARTWAAHEHLTVGFDEGNAESLPYADGAFETVLSMFGVMFAARPERVAAELARVTRRGGRVALATWTRDGFIGRMLALHGRFAPPPAGLPSPILWGDMDVVRERFPATEWELATAPRTLTFRYPHTPAGAAELFRGSYGPTVRTFAALGEDQRAEFNAALTDHWVRHHRVTPDGIEVDSAYLEIVATRR